MIHLYRDQVPAPAALRGPQARAAQARLAAHFAHRAGKRPQSDPFEADVWRAALVPLLELSHHKCAYCEQPITPSDAAVDHFRPEQLANAGTHPDHYWWLAYHWENLLPACATCTQQKLKFFPIVGERCRQGKKGEALGLEFPLLLDPARDHPERYLVVGENGVLLLRPLAAAGGYALRERCYFEQRATITIDLLQLNRSQLVDQRKVAYAEVQALMRICVRSQGQALRMAFKQLDEALGSHQPFACARRSAFWELRGMFGNTARQRYAGRMALARLTKALRSERNPTELKKHLHGVPFHQVMPVWLRPVRVRKVEVHDYRTFQRAVFAVPADKPKDLRLDYLSGPGKARTGRSCGWKVLLGENGAGKTSLLQAIAVALVGNELSPASRPAYALQWSVRNGARSKRHARITVELSTGARVEVYLGHGQRYHIVGEARDIYVRAYGSVRLYEEVKPPSLSEGPEPVNEPLKKIGNLFSARSELIDPLTWLAQLSASDRAHAFTTLKALLAIGRKDGDLELRKSAGYHYVGLRKGNRFTLLQEFSAGYQTLFALGCDIMAGLQEVSDMRYIPGIILIDELGADLHPRWRMEILYRLEQAFPQMQVIATTHEPLCLHGLGAGEVAVVEQDGKGSWVNDDLPSPAGLRADQLLTSAFFGLHSTVDPQVEAKFNAYYDLLAREEQLEGPAREDLERLRRELQGQSVLGSSRRDRLLLQVVDKVLARQQAAQGPLEVLDAEVLSEVEHALIALEEGKAARRP